MMNKFLKSVKKGFTLIELLVVIGIVGVLAAGVAVALDPLDKTRAANDAKVQQAVGTIASALKAYATTNGGNYPSAASFAALVTALYNNGDLGVSSIALPTGYSCVGGGDGLLDAKVTCRQQSKRSDSAGGDATPDIWSAFCHDASANTTTFVDLSTGAMPSDGFTASCP